MRNYLYRIINYHGQRCFSTTTYRFKVITDPENKGTRQSGINFDTLGSWSNRLELPVNIEQSARKGVLIPKIGVSHIAMHTSRGRRPVNEDRMIVKEIKNNFLLIAVFDGHGGPGAVDFCQEFVADFVKFYLERGETDLKKILHFSFMNLNNLLARHLFHYSRGKT